MVKKYFFSIALCVALGIFFTTSTVFFRNYTYLHQKGVWHGTRDKKITISTDTISGWMTFDYINHAFHIPNDYLKESLAISSAGYPKITIAKASTLQGMRTSLYIERVKRAIQDYKKNTQNPQ